MQTELAAEGLPLEIRFLGVNAIGQESATGAVVLGRTLPWLQDVPDRAAWQLWGARAGDVFILDEANRQHLAHNCGDESLDDAVHYESLKYEVRAAATP